MRRDGIEVAIAATVGAVIALVIWALMQDPNASPATDQNEQGAAQEAAAAGSEPTGSATTQPLREQADVEEFLRAFRSSRTGTYKLTGRVQEAQAGIDDTTQIVVSIVRRDADTVEIAGTTLVVSLDGQTQTCERVFGDDLVCGEVIASPVVDAEVAALAKLFTGAAPDYLLYDDQPGCWQLVATSNPTLTQWGQSTTICFDAETGAIVRQTTSSTQGTRTFAADTIVAEVSDDDLVPPT